jgi:hypothetical protein
MLQSTNKPEKLCGVPPEEEPVKITGTHMGVENESFQQFFSVDTAKTAEMPSAPASTLNQDIKEALQPRHKLIDLRSDNIYRPLSWRWALAAHVAMGSDMPEDMTDTTTRQLATYIEELRRCNDDAARVSFLIQITNVSTPSPPWPN